MIQPQLYLYNPLVYKQDFSKKDYFVIKEQLFPLGGSLQETLGGDYILNPCYKEKYRYILEGRGDLPLGHEYLFPGRVFWVIPSYPLQTSSGLKGDIQVLRHSCFLESLFFYNEDEESWYTSWKDKPENPPIEKDLPKDLMFSRVISPPNNTSVDIVFPDRGYFIYHPLLFCTLEDISMKKEDVAQWSLTFREI